MTEPFSAPPEAAPTPAQDCEGGVLVRWCPRCGTCTCPQQDGHPDRWVDDPGCPIHGDHSTHSEPAPPACQHEWRAVETAPKDEECWFWLEPLPEFTQGSIFDELPRPWHGPLRSWPSLYRATHWMPYYTPAAPPVQTCEWRDPRIEGSTLRRAGCCDMWESASHMVGWKGCPFCLKPLTVKGHDQ